MAAVINSQKAPGLYSIGQSGVPVIQVPNGTVSPSGVLTLVTALPTVFDRGAWVRLPAGAIAGGAAGLYWCVFSSTTVGAVKAVFIDPAMPFIPTIPEGNPPPAVGSGNAYAQTMTALITCFNVMLKGRTLGVGGRLRLSLLFQFPANANSKGMHLMFGSARVMTLSNPQSSSNQFRFLVEIQNRGTLDRQISTNWAGTGQGPDMFSPSSVDTSVDQPLAICTTLAQGTDYVILLAAGVEAIP